VVRIITLLWVCLSNFVFAWLVLSALLAERTLYGLLESRMPWEYYLLPVSIIVIFFVGVVLELANSQGAVFVNAGFFLLITACAAVGLAYGWQDPGSRTFGLPLHILAFLVLVIDILLYAAKKRLRQAGSLA
jgi:hypothetical protein